jgi:hypothetical protein
MALLPTTVESMEPRQKGPLRKRIGVLFCLMMKEVPAPQMVFDFKIYTFLKIIDKGNCLRVCMYVYMYIHKSL